MPHSDHLLHHLLQRAAFGPTPDLLDRFSGKELPVVVDALFRDSDIVQDLIYIDKPNTNDKGKVGPFKALFLILKSQKEKDDLNLAWIDRMAVAKASLREKMTLFWHNHFATGTAFGYLMQIQHNTLRKHALGNFGVMLHEMARDPAMIIWLNNQQNKKNAPNENFAREVMELFTLGEGNGYTEFDIKEAARAFTGWSVNQKGEYEFNAKQHDDGIKTVFGRTGNFNGDDIVDMLLGKRETAVYVCRKIYRTFVNIEVHEGRVQEMATRFYKSGYDIADLMHTVFNSEWFYSKENIGAIIVSPVELIVKYKKLCRLEMEDEQMLGLQHVLGQTLFSPPNVAGWKGGKSWIDASSIIQRLHMPRAILDAGTARLHRKPAFEAKDETGKKKNKDEQVKIKSDWSEVVKHFEKVPDNQLTQACMDYLLVTTTEHINIMELEKEIDTSSRQRRVITTLCAIMQFPESQII
jgi:uncharacterized protein (DUF1800 family)